MNNLKANSIHNIPGRGLTITINLDKQDLKSSIRIGDEIVVDDVKYKVNGIEAFSFTNYPPKKGNLFGLLVEKI